MNFLNSELSLLISIDLVERAIDIVVKLKDDICSYHHHVYV